MILSQCVIGLLPAVIQVVVGEPLRVTCIIPDHLAGVYDSSKLAFDFDKGDNVLHLVDDELVERVNRTVAVLNYPAMSIDWDKALVGCYVNASNSPAISRRMHVYSEPFSVF